MNTFNRIVGCCVMAALLGISGCVVAPGHMRHGDERDNQRDHGRDSRRDDHHGDNDSRDHGGCDHHKEDCREHM